MTDTVASKKVDSHTSPVDGSVSDNLLMISKKRPRPFYERAARELLASGHDSILLSALGDAILPAIYLANILQERNAAILTKIETRLVEFEPRYAEEKEPVRATGVSIHLAKHPEFKGTRIIPNSVIFCDDISSENEKAYPQQPDVEFGSVNYGNTQHFDSDSTGSYFSPILHATGLHPDSFTLVYDYLLKRALQDNLTAKRPEDIRVLSEGDEIKQYHQDLRSAFCRVCPVLKDTPGKPHIGSVFFYVFDKKKPHEHPNNVCLIHVVAPTAKDFTERAEFLNAVTLTATNLMTALCDFNGHLKRSQSKDDMQRLVAVRIPLISSDPTYIHPETTRSDIAKSLLMGLEKGYHFGTAPRLNIFDPTEVVRQVWLETTGRGVETLHVESQSFRRKSVTKKSKNPKP